MRTNTLVVTLIFAAIGVSPAASAHHSVAALFDQGQSIEISGELTRVFWRNPHVRLWIRDAAGKDWELETSVIGFFERAGVTSDLFVEGSTIRVMAHPARRADDSAYATNVLLADGREILMQPDAEPRWSNRILDGFDRLEIDAAVAADAERRADGIFRVWTNTENQEWTFVPTAAAVAARANWNPADDPRLRCEAPGMTDAMASPYPIELIRESDDVIVIRMEEWDGVRRVYLNGATDPVTAPTLMGHSIGHWDGNTLIVTTDRVDWPFFDNIGTPQSQNVQIVERFTLSDDQKSLSWEAVITDPENLQGPARVTQGYSWVPGEEIRKFDCAVPG